MTSGVAITLFVVGFVAAIMVHEWGHYWTARRFGMRVDRFFLGFGPTLWSTRRGETEYGVKALPLGGFVRVQGMSPEDERLASVADTVFDPERLATERRRRADAGEPRDREPAVPPETWDHLRRELARRGTPRGLRHRILHRVELNIPADATPAEARLKLTEILASEVPGTGRLGDLNHRLLRGDEGRFYPDRPAWQRAIVLASGSFMHFVQAFVLLFLGFLLFGQSTPLPTLAEISPGSAAAEAGLEVGDRIVAIDGEPVDGFEEVRGILRDSAGETLVLTVERDGERLDREVVPTPTTDPETGEEVGLLGFRPDVDFSPVGAVEALRETVVGPTSVPALTVETLRSLGRVFGPEGIGAIVDQVRGDTRQADGAISMVGAARFAGDGTAVLGPLFLFFLLASVNVFVGIFNILPLPPLDGGHLAVLGVEEAVNAVRARRGDRPDFRVEPRTIAAIALPVIVLVGTLSLALVWLDVVNPIQVTP